ncbi:esterase-like activity of phytase family protein [Actinoplanes sp. RD1]|uniref:esterase-like activity of phytase family protein n=1 Tax=Actinoplanes sp. RD1 TaxID=3064538 RepID=UPI0027404FE4|nr:esterase-like activity of phytase family protein [Actinoplanes sp. RD1]
MAFLPYLAAVAVGLSAAHPPAVPHEGQFRRLATVPAYLNSSVDDEAAAEISTVTDDGRTVVYTDSPGKRLGFLDISDAARPEPSGTLAIGGEPTSVAHLGHLLLAAVNTSAGFTDPSGKLVVIDDRTRKVVRSLDLGGQPDSVAVAPSGRYLAVAIENERDEDVFPLAPAGWLSVVDTRTWAVSRVALTGLASVVPEDPEPEYVSINARDEAVVTLQENNHIAVVNLAAKKVVSHFSAGTVTVDGVDTLDDDKIELTGSITARREPDGVTWISDELFATANEGDYEGGSRGWTVFDRRGRVVWDAGNSLERIAVQHGLYPDKRSDAKGIEPENVAFGRFGGVPYVFVNSERGNFTAVYDVSRPSSPKFRQLLPTTNGPEGVVAVPSRNLVVVSSEEEIPDANIRGSVQLFGFGPAAGAFPSVVSPRTIPFGTLSGLSAVPGTRSALVSVTDSAYTPTRILGVSVAGSPATITSELTVTKNGEPIGYDAEGIAAVRGGYWLAVEGSATTPNMLVRLNTRGEVQQEIPLPADVAAAITTNGLEGISVTGKDVWVAVQRPLKGETFARIGKYSGGTWSWLAYPLDTAAVGWTGLSELVAVPSGGFAVIERDNQRGPAAAIKKVYRFDVPASWTGVPTVRKRLVKDLLPALRADHGWVQDKVEGLAIAGNGQAYAVTDNDAIDDATGETVFLRLGRLF